MFMSIMLKPDTVCLRYFNMDKNKHSEQAKTCLETHPIYWVNSANKKYIFKFIKISKTLTMLRSFYKAAFLDKGFSIWILLFG